MSHMDESPHIWMSHGTYSHESHMNESRHTYACVVSHMNGSVHTYKWVTSHTWTSYATLEWVMNESHVTDLSHVVTSTHYSQSTHCRAEVCSHSLSRTRLNELCHIQMSHICLSRVIPHNVNTLQTVDALQENTRKIQIADMWHDSFHLTNLQSFSEWISIDGL